jgi:hypothetical protein
MLARAECSFDVYSPFQEFAMRNCVVMVAMVVLVLPLGVHGQDKSGVKSDKELELIKKENELLKRENDLLKKENELLKQELASLKKGGAKTPSEAGEYGPLVVTVDNVEYTYQGTVRNGPEMVVTVLATSKSGENRGPNGQLIITDDEGNRYAAMPVGGFGAPPLLREGVPYKMVWRFSPSLLGKQGSAPPSKVTKFASLALENVGGQSVVEFRSLPAVVVKPKGK